MAWIKVISPAEATGELKRLYDAVLKKRPKVKQVMQIQSLRPSTMRATNAWYADIMKSDKSPLSRARREMIAVVVSVANDCNY
ncbi:MAG: carboxymuconolactone decarboxylase family protein [Chloroflexota bacterium]